MSSTTRLGTLAIGLGLGAAVAVTPGVATPAPPDIGISMGGVALAAMDFDISIWGFDLFNGGGTAHATSTFGNMAFAFGPDSTATAEGGFGDFASAFSTGAGGAVAEAGDNGVGATGNNFDIASAVGNASDAVAGNPNGSFADTTGSSFDFASAVGGGGTLATSSLAEAGLNGSNDSASTVGQEVAAIAGESTTATAPANFDSASVLGNMSLAEAVQGNNDSAFVVDPFATLGSTAIAGAGNNFDLAGALGDALNPTSTGADFIAHILPFF